MSFFKADHLTIQFGGIRAVDGLSFEVAEGEVYTIIGPNGAGKTTIFNLISRIYDPTAGELIFQDRPFTTTPPHQIPKLGIARTFQNIELFEHETVLQNLLIGRHIHRKTNLFSELLFLPSAKQQEIKNREKVEEIIEFLDLQNYRDQYIASLPYGIRKIVELGRALAIEPTLLLLDEPSSGLNIDDTQEMGFWIEDINKDLGITVIMVEHDMLLVSQVSDRVLAMNDGKYLAQGTPEEVQNNPEVITAYLGEDHD